MKRRLCMALLGTAAVGPASGQAQPIGMPVIGYLCPEAPEPFASRIRAFSEGLAEAGYVDGHNATIQFRWAAGHYDRLPALAADLAARRVAVIVAPGGAPAVLAAKSATTTIPIVFEMGADPIALGVVRSLNRPEANLTGISSLSVEASLKRLELLHEVVQASRTANAAANPMVVGVVANPTSPTLNVQVGNLQAGAAALGVQLHILHASTEEQFGHAFEALARLRASALVFNSDPFFANRSQQLAALAARHVMPAIQQSRDFTIAGGLMSYGGDFTQSHRQSGVYTGLILKGTKPSDLPVQRITKLELLINLKTARSFGIRVPLSVLARADEVVE